MVSAIVLAGGKGKRMGAGISKQYIELNNKPILYYTLKKFIDCTHIDKVILVLPEDEIEYCKKEVLDKYSLKVDRLVKGGKERQDSVLNALLSIKDTDIVLIHDGARPFVSEDVIKNGISLARLYGAAAPGVMPKDTIKLKDKSGFSIETPKRENLVSIQTPQVFKFDIILECHKKIKSEEISVTDDTMVVEKYNNKVYLYEGDYTNIKITTPEDLILGERLIRL
ncbi:2-C-methyl-D-erythritol 4-phosphate cytidylyltransferase [Clostridium septicum]|uniref:2-C-methyl-D-erythritol 4-phosphate cytidylyltransferase n=1 Tax=Clostridium septicum TaxID=1504 RepID=A0A9N7JLB6_CLOSE|nr:2-C-methyl-D-erythritol 4-phosphate cytidylyltransferase [Clostridium septicum]AYE34518.1 2-C-methyl-D-erythritol 4-phosphate cytidylyltransferase [Clostridium septicum]MDU1315200.1 2-C-methyl-D-erythritol 4-phosphate cytidylyltransferase [Clostridium septicum]QAS59920.1 2-C-methyl-D-erythritol 4-phosphate cytidylyltransferase [Clostridium septicum]UEC20842.1 2-C-methyl-D-erythritol 4-phosphate cytidylyltransferase [Clostridium septicum]USS01108.1 2-C-methyl-D-erythritol 4-phosphate cytidyl